MITVRLTGGVILSANNIVNYVFISSRLFKGVNIFSNKILPLIRFMRVYIVGIIF